MRPRCGAVSGTQMSRNKRAAARVATRQKRKTAGKMGMIQYQAAGRLWKNDEGSGERDRLERTSERASTFSSRARERRGEIARSPARPEGKSESRKSRSRDDASRAFQRYG